LACRRAQHTEKQRPATHYNNKIHVLVDKTLSSLMFTLKRTVKKVSLQLSFESKEAAIIGESTAADFFTSHV